MFSLAVLAKQARYRMPEWLTVSVQLRVFSTTRESPSLIIDIAELQLRCPLRKWRVYCTCTYYKICTVVYSILIFIFILRY